MPMSTFKLLLAAVAFSFSTFASAEIGDTNVIDAIATKPDSQIATLLLFQARSWDAGVLDLLAKKVEFYRLSVTSGKLVEKRSDLADKKIRFVIVYAEQPSDAALEALQKDQRELADDHIELFWSGKQGLSSVIAHP